MKGQDKQVNNLVPAQIIDNLGGGDCGAYAFIIGTLQLAKQFGQIRCIEKWKQLDASPLTDDLLETALSLDYSSQKSIASFATNKELIIPLMQSIRHILLNDYLNFIPLSSDSSQMLSRINCQINPVYLEFAQICEKETGNLLDDYSDEALAPNFLFTYGGNFYRELAKKVAEVYKNELKEITNPTHSNQANLLSDIIIAAITVNLKKFRESYKSICLGHSWLNDSHLRRLAELLDLTIILNHTFNTRPKESFLHLINHSNQHWVTQMYDPNYQYPFRQITIDSQFRNNFDLFKQVHILHFIQNIELFKLDFPQLTEVLEIKIKKCSELLETAGIQDIYSSDKFNQGTLDISKFNDDEKNNLIQILDEDYFYFYFSKFIEALNESNKDSDDLNLNIEKYRLLNYLDSSYQSTLTYYLNLRQNTTAEEQNISIYNEKLNAVQLTKYIPSFFENKNPKNTLTEQPYFNLNGLQQASIGFFLTEVSILSLNLALSSFLSINIPFLIPIMMVSGILVILLSNINEPLFFRDLSKHKPIPNNSSLSVCNI